VDFRDPAYKGRKRRWRGRKGEEGERTGGKGVYLNH